MRRVHVPELAADSESDSESRPNADDDEDFDLDLARDAYLRHVRFAEAVGGLATGMTGLVLAILFAF